MILIYHQNLLKDTTNIKNISYPKESQNLNLKITNLLENIYCLYDINDEELLNNIKPTIYKTIENIYNKNKYFNSFIVFYKDIVYLFLKDKDYIFKGRDLFYIP